jgi:hypothetical protein
VPSRTFYFLFSKDAMEMPIALGTSPRSRAWFRALKAEEELVGVQDVEPLKECRLF